MQSRLDAPLDAAAQHTNATELKAYRERNDAARLEVVRSEGASTLVALEMAVSGGSDDDARSRSVRMFTLLSKQMLAGMGRPSEQQLVGATALTLTL